MAKKGFSMVLNLFVFLVLSGLALLAYQAITTGP